MTANTGGAVEIDLLVEAGADWPGIRVPLYDATGAAFDPSSCLAHGEIKAYPSDVEALFTWSSDPGPGQGAIACEPAGVRWWLLGADTSGWTWTEAHYEIKLFNPNAPEGDRDIRVAQGAVLIDPQLDRTPLP